jgi:hypothetical protein
MPRGLCTREASHFPVAALLRRRKMRKLCGARDQLSQRLRRRLLARVRARRRNRDDERQERMIKAVLLDMLRRS